MTLLTTAALALTLSAQTMLPVGSSPDFQSSCVRVAEVLSSKKFPQGLALANRLPRATFSVEVQEKGVPVTQRKDFLAAVDAAIAQWQASVPSLKIRRAPVGDLRISFVNQLPIRPESASPAGFAVTSSNELKGPVTELVVGLARGQGLQAGPGEVRNAAAFGIGSYLGLTSSPIFGNTMARFDGLANNATRITPLQKRTVEANLNIADTLRKSAAAKQPVKFALARAAYDRLVLVPPTTLQGDDAVISFPISNGGDAPLVVQIVADCGCFRLNYEAAVKPGNSNNVNVTIDTANFEGNFDKKLYIYTNGPEQPERTLPVRFYIKPRYTMTQTPPGDSLVMSETGLRLQLRIVPNVPTKILRGEVSGIPAVMDFKPWKGEVDGKMAEGYEAQVLIAPSSLIGRQPLTLAFLTDDPKLQQITHSVFVQRGIVATPSTVYFGQVGRLPKEARFIVTRPGQPFRIKSVRTSIPGMKVFPIAGKLTDSYSFKVVYSGQSAAGSIRGVVIVETDAPDQPEIRVPIEAEAE